MSLQPSYAKPFVNTFPSHAMQVPSHLGHITENRMMDIGSGCDLISVGELPMHRVPLLISRTAPEPLAEVVTATATDGPTKAQPSEPQRPSAQVLGATSTGGFKRRAGSYASLADREKEKEREPLTGTCLVFVPACLLCHSCSCAYVYALLFIAAGSRVYYPFRF